MRLRVSWRLNSRLTLRCAQLFSLCFVFFSFDDFAGFSFSRNFLRFSFFFPFFSLPPFSLISFPLRFWTLNAPPQQLLCKMKCTLTVTCHQDEHGSLFVSQALFPAVCTCFFSQRVCLSRLLPRPTPTWNS